MKLGFAVPKNSEVKIRLFSYLLLPIITMASLTSQAKPDLEIGIPENVAAQFEIDEKSLIEDPINESNKKLIGALGRFSPLPARAGRRQGATLVELTKLLNQSTDHPVISMQHADEYNPGTGFCFGRAMYFHLELLRLGISKDSIFKLYIVGNMSTGTADWKWHVTTVVYTAELGWVAIDPVIGKVISVPDWVIKINKYAKNGRLRLYLENSDRVIPYGDKHSNFPTHYGSRTDGGNSKFFASEYNGYFADMFSYLRSASKLRKLNRGKQGDYSKEAGEAVVAFLLGNTHSLWRVQDLNKVRSWWATVPSEERAESLSRILKATLVGHPEWRIPPNDLVELSLELAKDISSGFDPQTLPEGIRKNFTDQNSGVNSTQIRCMNIFH